jgi:hypothetical protein
MHYQADAVSRQWAGVWSLVCQDGRGFKAALRTHDADAFTANTFKVFSGVDAVSRQEFIEELAGSKHSVQDIKKLGDALLRRMWIRPHIRLHPDLSGLTGHPSSTRSRKNILGNQAQQKVEFLHKQWPATGVFKVGGTRTQPGKLTWEEAKLAPFWCKSEFASLRAAVLQVPVATVGIASSESRLVMSNKHTATWGPPLEEDDIAFAYKAMIVVIKDEKRTPMQFHSYREAFRQGACTVDFGSLACGLPRLHVHNLCQYA